MLATKPALDLSRIGASDAPGILGVDRYGSAFDVWARIVHGVDKNVGGFASEAAYWGSTMEPAILSAWTERRGLDLGAVVKPDSRVSTVREWQRMSLDGLIYDDTAPGGAHVTEAKCVGQLRFGLEEWGAEGTSEVPLRIVAQVTCQLEAMRAEREWWLGEYCVDPAEIDRVHVAVLVGGAELRAYAVPYDAELGGLIAGKCESLWRDWIVPKKTPPADFGGATTAALARLYPKATQPLRPATEEEAELARRHATLRAEIKRLEADKKTTEAQLAQAIAEAQGLSVDDGAVKWISRKGMPSWKSIAEQLALRAGVAGRDLAALVAENTGAPTRYITNSLAVDAAEED